MTRDFTLSKYRELCKTFLSLGYNTITVQEYIQGQAVEPSSSCGMMWTEDWRWPLGMAGMEKDMGIRATYYFRMMPGGSSPG